MNCALPQNTFASVSAPKEVTFKKFDICLSVPTGCLPGGFDVQREEAPFVLRIEGALWGSEMQELEVRPRQLRRAYLQNSFTEKKNKLLSCSHCYFWALLLAAKCKSSLIQRSLSVLEQGTHSVKLVTLQGTDSGRSRSGKCQEIKLAW